MKTLLVGLDNKIFYWGLKQVSSKSFGMQFLCRKLFYYKQIHFENTSNICIFNTFFLHFFASSWYGYNSSLAISFCFICILWRKHIHLHFSIAHRNKIIFTDPCSAVFSKLPFVCIYIRMLGVQVMNETK